MTHTSALDDRFDVRADRKSFSRADAGRVLNSIRDFALITLDPQGNIVSWNAGAEHIYGWEAEKILGLHFSLLYPSDARAQEKPLRDLKAAKSLGHSADQVRCAKKNGIRVFDGLVQLARRRVP